MVHYLAWTFDRKAVQVKAYITVSNKLGVDWFARELHARGFSLLATPHSAQMIRDAGIPVDVTDQSHNALVGIIERHLVSCYKLLHAALVCPKEDRELAENVGITLIDLLCIDLFPIERVAYDEARPISETFEEFDSGGSSLILDAFKGKREIICDPMDRAPYLDWIDAGRPDAENIIFAMGLKARTYLDEHFGHLEQRIQREFQGPKNGSIFPPLNRLGRKVTPLLPH